MSLNRIFTYWEGRKPDYIKLCEKSLVLHCYKNFKIEFLNEKQDYFILPDIPINLKVDWLKANLIRKYGGFWIDADMIVMQDLSPLVEVIQRHKFAGIPGFFGSVKGAPILKRWCRGMRKILKKDLAFSDLIQPLLHDQEFEEFGVFSREMICPVYHTGDEFWTLFDNEIPIEKIVNDKTFVFTLYNSQFNDEFKALTQLEVLIKQWLISKVFRKSLL